jgi:hypothetical protein
MSKKVLIDVFFNQFNTFLDELRHMYPEDSDFPTFITTLAMMKSTNPMLVVNFVKTEIIDPYGEKISARDESFFLNQEYAGPDVDLNIIEKLKQYIQTMTPENKSVVWSYIEVITQICARVLA